MNSQTTVRGQKLDTKGKDSQSMDNECVAIKSKHSQSKESQNTNTRNRQWKHGQVMSSPITLTHTPINPLTTPPLHTPI